MHEAPTEHARVKDSLELELERGNQAPAVARAALRGLCHERGLSPSLRHTLALLTSEVVSNAVLHSDGPAEAPILLQASIDSGRVRVAVSDAGEGFIEKPRDRDRCGGGYGLYLLQKAASSWGVESRGGTQVWFELSGEI
ncbi:MAG TPA: ATP-binding protein [Solirubrobacteraceae bacterium]